ncbi:COQ9 family protein [Pikeienuella piscinae]|uniref:COQ9 family protein n=1 Tax=Pikeienuella piscinae TaxID=2748098 RepID=A0A7M3T647_9RHOB|nr:COQ9 family protein [Pikeienuella piscinae]QIE57478.1 COQ9 family protein [Pikeienuella piscinae]
MSEENRTEPDRLEQTRAALLEAALVHAPFDGWTDATWRAALADTGIDEATARAAAPRRGFDLAVAFHKAGDEEMKRLAAETDLSALRYSERVAKLIRIRLEVAEMHREAVRRGATLFSLPMNAAEGARLIWGTADAVWSALGDTSEDFNWYSKRAILSGVYSSTLLYWLGDQSEGHERTWAFLDRRISDVMRFEKAKAQARKNPLTRVLMAGPAAALARIRAPGAGRIGTGLPVGLPGRRR